MIGSVGEVILSDPIIRKAKPMERKGARRGHAQGNARPGFTLVELLVVVAVIALLLSMLAPALGKAKVYANTAICQTNLNNIGRAAMLYAADNKNYVPRDYWYGCNVPGHNDYKHYLFAAKLAPYLGGTEIAEADQDRDPVIYKVLKNLPVFLCPSVKKEKFVLTYVVNGMDFEVYRTRRSYTSGPASCLDDLPGAPTRIFYVMESNIAMLDPERFGIYDVLYPGNMPFNGTTPNDYPRAIRYDDNRHDGRTTMVFFDGHCERRDLHPDDLPLSIFNPLAPN